MVAFKAGDLVRVVSAWEAAAGTRSTWDDLPVWDEEGDPIDVACAIGVFLRRTEYDDFDVDWIVELGMTAGVCYTLMSNLERL